MTTYPRPDVSISAATPLVSIVVPCRDEASFIEACVRSLLGGTYPRNRVEILVVDGMSSDGTRDIVAHISVEHREVRLIDNPQRTIPAALNRGIRASTGSLVIRADAHARYDPEYVTESVMAQTRLRAAGVGGYVRTETAGGGLAPLLASVWASPFGLGGERSKTRRPDKNEVREVDVIFGGCYPRELFERVGYYDERLIGSEDIDFHHRVRHAGGHLYLVPTIRCTYFFKATSLRKFLRKTFHNGFWTTYPIRYVGSYRLGLRHLVPAFFVIALCAGVAAGALDRRGYSILAIICAAYLVVGTVTFARGVGGLGGVVAKLAIAFLMHTTYGLGSIWGALLTVYDLSAARFRRSYLRPDAHLDGSR